MKKIILFVIIIMFASHAAIAQQQMIRCGDVEYMAKKITSDPSLQHRLDSIENATELWIANHPRYEMKFRITIPVVVHIVWNTNEQDISDEQIQSQINVLNEDFNRMNSDTTNTPSYFKQYASSLPFDFCLASRDPNGNWTNGIVRKYTTDTCIGGDISDNIKCPYYGGDTAWDPNSYLNIWVGCINDPYLGWCPLPNGNLEYTDGATVKWQAFGKGFPNLLPAYNLGRTTTHEIGHWLNLHHPWGDGNGGCCTCTDYVYDTPYQDSPTYNCPVGPQISCNDGPDGNMYEVYMDYTEDACMNMFSFGQTSRMMATLNGVRQEFLNSNGCLVNRIEYMPNLKSINLMPNPATDLLTLDINLVKNDNITYSLVNMLGSVVYTNVIGISSGGKYTINTSKIPAGIYSLQLQLSKQTINQKVVIIH